jgi:uncharacterized membrane protein
MLETILTILIIAAALGSGLVAGTFFAFSAFVMKALGETPGTGGIEAMQRINKVILRSVFMPVFTGTAILSVALATWGFVALDFARAIVLSAGAVLYVVCTFILTIRFNVPLNTALDRAKPEEAEKLWREYRVDWTRWNTIRTVCAAMAMVCFAMAL